MTIHTSDGPQTVTSSANSAQTKATQTAIQKHEAAIQRVSKYLDSDTVRSRFASVVGVRNAGAYIGSVMIAIRESPALQECNLDSLYISALRAATLRLSVDQATGQAYLVPFKGRATLIVGYKGLYDMAVRTGRYRYINVGPIYEGMAVDENVLTGFHSVTGKRTSDRILGWIGAFEMRNGFAKTIYMTVEEIHAHAKQYSKSYENSNSGWKTDTAKMERKTVLRLLLRRWGYLDPADVQALNEVDDADSVDAESTDIYVPDYQEDVPVTVTDSGNPDPIDDKAWQMWQEMCARADAMKIPHPNPSRETTTKTDLRDAYNELGEAIKAVHAQAVAS